MNNDDSDQMKTSFKALLEYTVHHFAHEEKYMEQIQYPALDSHKKVHKNLIDVLIKFKNQLDAGELSNAKLTSFLKNWLFTHIMGIDTKYAKHAFENNSKQAA